MESENKEEYSEVKIWYAVGIPIGVSLNLEETNHGPYHELSKRECHKLSEEIKNKIEEKINWNKPDKKILVKAKHYDDKTVKPTIN